MPKDLTTATLSDLATMRDRNVGAVREAANAELERRAGVSPTAPETAPDPDPAPPAADHTAEERAALEAERARVDAELAALPAEPTP